MRPRSLLPVLIASLAWLAPPAYCAGLGLKPGLWDIHLTKQVVDGRDVSGQLAASLAQAQQALANLPPAERARLQAMLDQAGVNQGANGSFRICVSPEMAKRDMPILDKDASCRPLALNRSADRISFQFNCTSHGTTMTGKGEATVANGLIKTRTDLTTRSASGVTHAVQNETEMQFVGPDCGSIKPAG